MVEDSNVDEMDETDIEISKGGYWSSVLGCLGCLGVEWKMRGAENQSRV